MRIRNEFIRLIATILLYIPILTYAGNSNQECTDRMYIEDISVEAGKVFEIPVKLDNENTYSAFQCDILLPQGIEMETDEDGELSVYAENSRMTTSHTITAHLREDGWIRVASYSTTSKNLKGNSGTLFYIKAKVSSDYSGEMVIRMKEIIMSNADAETVTLEDTEAVISVTPYQGENPECTDRMYIEDISVEAGKVFEIPVKLDNENTYSAFQCDILLPQGIEMETDEDGELSVYAENSRMTTSHTITAHLREDGWIRVASYSTTSKDLKGNSGTLFYIKAKVSSDYSGEMVIRMKEIIMSNAEAETVALEDTEAVISVTPYQGENPECKDRMYIEDISVEAGKVFEIPVKLDNENTYSAFQCDILLPQGIEMETDEDGELSVYAENSRMTTSHTITAHLREDGWIRVASYSTTSKNLKGNSGTLFYIKAKVNSDYSGEMVIRMKKIIMSNAEAETVTLEDTEAVISVGTHINNVLINNEFTDIYTLQGIVVKPGNSANRYKKELPSGIYIINGKKVYIKQK